MVRTQIQLTESQAERRKRLAVLAGVSMATLIRRGGDRILASREPVDRSARLERALGAVGRFQSGRGDLSKKHDDHFAEAADE